MYIKFTADIIYIYIYKSIESYINHENHGNREAKKISMRYSIVVGLCHFLSYDSENVHVFKSQNAGIVDGKMSC